MRTYGVIMAGGGGTRFWPLSRKKMPKQFLNLTGKDAMVNETIDRLLGCVAQEDIFIVTNASQAELTQKIAGSRIRTDHILAEPAARNTAACIGYAAMEIVQKYEDGIMCILASDHYIRNEEAFKTVLSSAVRTAEKSDKLVTIGITPSFPATGYGYIKRSGQQEQSGYQVEEFVEKPDFETAEHYVAQGDYLWNSGMFIWKASTILKKFEKLLPDIYEPLKRIGDAMGTQREQEILQQVYPGIPKISVDYGIMERSEDVLVIPGDFGWNDVGSWDVLEALYPADTEGNVNYGKQLHIDTKNCICYGQHKLIATIGVEDLIVVETEDVVMVCNKDRAQDVKKAVDLLQEQGMDEFL